MENSAIDFSLVTLRRKDGRNKKKDRKSMEGKRQGILIKNMDITITREKKRLEEELKTTKKYLELEKKKNNVLKVKYAELHSIYKRKCGGYYKASNAERRSINKAAVKRERRKSKAFKIPTNCDTNYDKIQMLQAEIDGLKESTNDIMEKSIEETILDVFVENEKMMKALKAEKESEKENNAKLKAKIAELEATIKSANIEFKELQSNVDDLTKENAIIMENEQKAQMIIAELNLKMKAENTKQKEIEDELRAKAVIFEQKYLFSRQQYQSTKNTNNELTMLITDIRERMAIFGQKESENIAKIKGYEKSIVLLQKAVRIHKKTISKLNIKEEPDKPESCVPATTYAIDEHQNFSFFKLRQNDKEKVDEFVFHKIITLDEIRIDSFDEKRLRGRILVIESICPIKDEDSWEAYSNFDCTGKPVKISLKKDTPKFMLQLNGRLNVCDAKIDVNSLLSHLHSCHLKDLRLVDQTISENDFIKLVSSMTIEKFIFCRNTVINDKEMRSMKMEEILKHLPNVEKFEYWLKNGENVESFDDSQIFLKLQTFSLYNLRDDFDLFLFSQFIKNHSNVNFTFKFCPIIPKRVKENILSMKYEMLQSLPSTVQINIAFS